MNKILDLYKAHYEHYCDCFNNKHSKYSWVAHEVFDLTTYDSGLDELFVKNILEVCKVILEGQNFEYIKDEGNYVKYILVCQVLDTFNWIEWGTSIRGAWFEGYHPNCKTRPILEEAEWWGPEWTADGEMVRHTIDSVRFSKENMRALIEFMEE